MVVDPKNTFSKKGKYYYGKLHFTLLPIIL